MSTTTSVSPDLRRIWRGARVPLGLLLLIVLVALALVLSRGGQLNGDLEPGSYEPRGSHALAHLLQEEGVDVRPVHTIAEALQQADGGTLVVTAPERVPDNGLPDLRRRVAHLVLVAPDAKALSTVVPTVTTAGTTDVRTLAPGCTVGAAVGAGTATLGGMLFRTDDSEARQCYRDGRNPTLVQFADRTGTVTLLGTGAPLTNDRLADDGNAALGLRLLGDHQRLVWYVPSPNDPALGDGQKSFYEVIPSGWRYGAFTAGIAVVLFALWRARRLGPVVNEPLPVLVRAAETAEGRARLYRRGGAAGHAAETLREAARTRLRTRLGLPREAEAAAVVEAVSARTGRPAAEVGGVLYGSPPEDDAGLVRLADELDTVEREVERS
ncbi:DUF4350 domain-containing protein [Amycolatopsis sp. FDAARGOS 1241]|uniref:DUF4350 domain-containing protein n=1 Tax=Amycolatopsis sp. FDAARGOS 1241 TaxID=2778070 RepID=UPI00194F48B9|nr:DUF4350 domain-containing protein [Amycolatopsis sp. FDAARGOS 1241]QRP45015.1 DUF4350 domain-containing protein [Amycolatopsis sp. FDAARGOS 1241]